MFQLLLPDDLAPICHYCLFLKDLVWKHTAYHINNSLQSWPHALEAAIRKKIEDNFCQSI